MNVVFVNRFFHPDHSATAQILSDLAFGLADRGRQVTVVTSRLHYDRPAAALRARETVAGVNVRRVWSTRFGRKSVLGRSLDYLTFYASAMIAVARCVRRGDIVIAMTDPPMLASPLAGIVRARRAHLVVWLQDIFPEIVGALGLGPVRFFPLGWLRSMRDRSLRRADKVVVLGSSMERFVGRLGVPADRIVTIPNWADDRQLNPVDTHTNPLRRLWGLEEKIVIGYSGNLGRAHEFETLLRAAELLGDRPDLVFLFIGGGHGRAELKARVEAMGDTRFRFEPYQERSSLSESLSVADIHWTSLRPELEGLIVPSKVYGIAAVGRPIVHVGDPDGEIGRLVRDHACGRAVYESDAAGLAGALAELADDESLRAAMGSRARRMIDESCHFQGRLVAWEGVLDEYGDHSRCGASPAEATEQRRGA